MHPLILLPAYLAVTVAPLVLSWLQDLPPRPFWDEVSSGLAMAAFAIMLAEFVLSGRLRTISGSIGMDVTMRFHQLVARTALAFVLLHPFLYSTPFGRALPWDTTGQLSLGLDTASLASGVIAWVILPGFVLIAVLRDRQPFRYETWRLLHLLGAVVVAVAVTHHTLAAGRYSADPWLAGFWLLLVTTAVGSLAWSRLAAPLLKARHPYEVCGLRRIALRSWELGIRPIRGPALRFRAGQFVWLNIGHSPFSLHENPFSISSAPAQRPEIRFVVKEVGDFTRSLGTVAPGTRVWLDGPHGNLTLDGRSAAGVALIAGGVGIAPLLGIARQMLAEGDRRPLVLLYGNRVAGQIVYGDELAALADRPATRVVHVVSEPAADWTGEVGQIDRAIVERVFGPEGAADWLYLVCGPPAMIDVVEDALTGIGVPSGRILSERFYYD
ncbi:MAG: ferredoxin reductase family protein [Thalassobaculum sp.]|uniref:ferredoxin reductase family protein n=1 Tax=Thalassobaculum sp. TaxID=2022740 RepID=UPI0032ED1B60